MLKDRIEKIKKILEETMKTKAAKTALAAARSKVKAAK